MSDKVYCSNCVRWWLYAKSRTDQCNIPDYFSQTSWSHPSDYLSDEQKKKRAFALKKQDHVSVSDYDDHAYGMPSKLNAKNDCVFYKPRSIDPWWKLW